MRKTRKSTARHSTSDAVEVLNRLFVGDSLAKREKADRAFEQAVVGHLIHQARVKAGLTQGQLAAMIDTDQGVISRLESADYAGHSLTMLRRIAAALGKRIEIKFVDAA